MDHWGDPWADNAIDKSPRKIEVASPLPPSHPSGPVLLNGFVDDAGWGNDDEGFGDWASPASDVVAQNSETRLPDRGPLDDPKEAQDSLPWNTEEIRDQLEPSDKADWLEELQDTAVGQDNHESETSDSSTTIQPDDATAPIATNSANSLHLDDDSSAHASTSPSETSHNEAPAESPRTSIEEERSARKHVALDLNTEEQPAVEDGSVNVEAVELHTSESGSIKDELIKAPTDTDGIDGNAVEVENAHDADDHATPISKELEFPREDSPKAPPHTRKAHVDGISAPIIDVALLDELFPAAKDTKELEEAPDNPIFSTAGRKAWYRLTRRQTLREFNMGTSDDNYIRVTWANSHIRSEVNKIVGRWAREDRISGTGPGARASFYWDTPAPVEPKSTINHSRTQSSISTQRTIVPVRQSLPPLATTTPAAFDWSSPSASADPWKQDNPGLTSVVSPIALKHVIDEKVQTRENSAVSPNLVLQKSDPVTQKRTEPTANETPIASHLISPPEPQASSTSLDPWSGLSSLDTGTSEKLPALAAIDDDDDWGEMVSSPTVSTPIATETTSQITTRNNTLSTLASTPQSVQASLAQDPSADMMHASPIVRLKSTISPTSAIFGAKSFIPMNVEQGPIGPSILKPPKRSFSFVKAEPQTQSLAVKEVEVKRCEEEETEASLPNEFAQKSVIPETTPTQVDAEDDFSAFTTSIANPVRPSTPPPPATATTITDSWADADFSFFETAAPAATEPQPQPDSSVAFSVFNTPPRSASVASLAKPFTRSPPRNITPPPLQPLTGATNSAQRRKMEEDQVIGQILRGLPDLSYMLR